MWPSACWMEASWSKRVVMNWSLMPLLFWNAICVQGPGPCNGWMMTKSSNHGKSLISHKAGVRHLRKMRQPIGRVSKPGHKVQGRTELWIKLTACLTEVKVPVQ